MTKVNEGWIGYTLGEGRYTVESVLGEGGFGIVYRAWDNNLETWVVIKVPRANLLSEPNVAKRFLREVRTLVQLAHPHIVKVHDVGQRGDCPYAIMQYLSGGSLEDRLQRDSQGNLVSRPLAEVGAMLQSLASALDFIHGRGFVHRDIKPANILFDEHGHLFLSDFGIVKVLSTAANERATRGLTGTGMFLGTLEYVAPEAVDGRDVDGRADQYSLAAMTYELLAGRLPFPATGMRELVISQLKPAPSLNELRPEVPVPAANIVARALSSAPELRFASCTEFADQFQRQIGSRVVNPATSKTSPKSIDRPTCPRCSAELSFGTEHAGRRIRCLDCRTVFRVGADLSLTTSVNSGGSDASPQQVRETTTQQQKITTEKRKIQAPVVTGGVAAKPISKSSVRPALDNPSKVKAIFVKARADAEADAGEFSDDHLILAPCLMTFFVVATSFLRMLFDTESAVSLVFHWAQVAILISMIQLMLKPKATLVLFAGLSGLLVAFTSSLFLQPFLWPIIKDVVGYISDDNRMVSTFVTMAWANFLLSLLVAPLAFLNLRHHFAALRFCILQSVVLVIGFTVWRQFDGLVALGKNLEVVSVLVRMALSPVTFSSYQRGDWFGAAGIIVV